MELAYNPVIHQGYIQVYDRDDKEWGALYLGNGNVGIGDLRPDHKLTVAGIIHSSSGGIKFPDGTLQTTAAASSGSGGVWNQVPVNALLSSTFSDKATITITPPSSDGYFVLTFSGACSNLDKSTDTRFHIYLNDTSNSNSSYAGYLSFWQDANGGHTRQVPLHSTRIISNSSSSDQTFYLNAGDSLDGGYTLYGMFMVQWFPGSQQN
jgi:hypothetical protein